MLSTKAGIGLRTLQDFESERRKPIQVVRTSIRQALEQAGIQFTDGNGVRFRDG